MATHSRNSCLENSMDRGAWWTTYSPWGRKESNTTEQLTERNSNVYAILLLLFVSKLCPIVCDPMDYSPLGPSDRGISQTRILQWVVNSFSKGSSWLRQQTLASCVSFNGRQIIHCWATRKALYVTSIYIWMHSISSLISSSIQSK